MPLKNVALIKMIEDGLVERRDFFKPYKARLDIGARMLDPRPGQTDLTTPKRVQSALERARLAKSEYLTNFYSTGITDIASRLSAGGLVINVAQADQPESEQIKDGLLEYFGLGIFNRLDSQAFASAIDINWRGQVHQYPLKTGKVIGIPRLKDLGDGKIDVEWPLYDPGLCYHDFGNDPPRRFYCEYEERPEVVRLQMEQMRRQYPDDWIVEAASKVDFQDKKTLSLTICYVEDWQDDKIVVFNGFLVDNRLVMLRETKFKRWPVLIGTVGGSIGTVRSNSSEQDFIRNHAHSLLMDGENIYEIYNQLKSLELDGLALAIRPPIEEIAEDGALFLSPEAIAPGSILSHRPDQILKLMEYAQNGMVANATTLAGLEQQQRYIIPDIVRAGSAVDAGASGYRYFQETESGQIRIQSYAAASNTFMEQGLMELIEQFREMPGSPRLRLDAVAPKGERMGQFFSRTFSKKDIPESTVLRVQSGPLLPSDEMRSLRIFQIALEVGIDSVYGMDRYLKIQDPASIKRRKQQEQLENSPQMMQLRLLDLLREKVQAAEEEAARAARDTTQGSLEHKMALLKALTLRSEIEALASQMLQARGLPTPKGPAGIPPEIMPPEQMGLDSPDEQMAVAGVAPSPQATNGSKPGRARRLGKEQ